MPRTPSKDATMPDQRKYRTIVADPPWHYDVASIYSDPIYRTDEGTRGSKPMAYPTMTVEEICAVPVSRLVDAQGCHLYLWTTQRYMRRAYEVLDFCRPSAWLAGTLRASGCAGGPYLEMFSRRARLGWDTWGNESLHGGAA